MIRTCGLLLAVGLLVSGVVWSGENAAPAAATAETYAYSPAPQWFQDLTRLAYIDLGNIDSQSTKGQAVRF